MNETPALPPPDPPPETPAARRRLNPVPVLYAAGFLILAAAVIWLWQNPPLRSSQPRVDPAQVAALQQQVQGLEQRLGQLEHRPVPAAPDLKPIEARLSALEHRQGPDLAPLEQRMSALDGKTSALDGKTSALEGKTSALDGKASALDGKTAELGQRIAALEARPQVPGDVATRVDLANLATRIDALAGREDQLATRQQSLETNLGNRVDAADNRIGTLQHEAAGLSGLAGEVQATGKRVDAVEKEAGQVSGLADKASRIGRLQAAQAALEAGQPLGDIPGAPPSLTRFAQAKPPTEAELRLSFPAAAQAAEEASRPPTAGRPFLDRVWTRAQDLVTVREGDRVVVGDPAAGVLARARHALGAGDLAGAVAALDDLSGPAADAMADWKGRARALLDARAALAGLAAHA